MRKITSQLFRALSNSSLIPACTACTPSTGKLYCTLLIWVSLAGFAFAAGNIAVEFEKQVLPLPHLPLTDTKI